MKPKINLRKGLDKVGGGEISTLLFNVRKGEQNGTRSKKA